MINHLSPNATIYSIKCSNMALAMLTGLKACFYICTPQHVVLSGVK